MQRCPDCSRHVWEREIRCPFCSGLLSYVQGSAPVMFAALVGLTIFACNGDDGDDTTTTGESVGTDSMSSTNDVPTTSTSEPTTSSSTTTSEGSSTSTSDTSTSTSEGSSTSTSEGSSTSTSDTSTSSETDSSSTSTGETTGETDTGTTQMTTGGECMGRGEEICGGICVNTQENPEHCGVCFNMCNVDQGDECIQGECMVVILPYGAPMPEPLWI